ncbi:MAG TPA: hypothetical protein VFU21_03725 [Kofleriaceae bacterium]|nr:hypothetical protein [Kofleriaceae bacterium]
MSKPRWSVAVTAAALLAFAGSDAEAGKGRIKSSSSLQIKDGKVTSQRKLNHNRGLRGKLTGGFLGRTIAVQSEQGAAGNSVTTERGGSKVARTFARTEDGRGTRAQGVHDKRRFGRIFGRAKKLERTDIVTPEQVTQDAIQHRTFRKEKRTIRTHKRGQPNGAEQVGYRDGTQWVGEPGTASVGRGSDAWGGKLKGDRAVMDTPDGMVIAEAQTGKYGRLSKVVKRVLTSPITLASAILTLGIAPVTFGKTREVKLEEWQSPTGNGFELTTPNARVVSSTAIRDNHTESITTRFRKGVERETETTRIWNDVGTSERHVKDRKGRTEKVIRTRLTPDGVHTEWTAHLRRDGSVSKVVVKETRPRADKPSRTRTTKQSQKFPAGTRLEDLGAPAPAASAAPVAATPAAAPTPLRRTRPERRSRAAE